MPLTPKDVVDKQFAKVFRGYDTDEVDAFLDEVEEELKRLLTENSQMVTRTAAAARVATPEPMAAAPVVVEPEESQQAALRTLLMAQRTADQTIEEARADAEKVLAEARHRASMVDNEINARTTAALAQLEGQRRELEARIEDLRAFEREYRLRLKAYLESQLKDLDTRGNGPSELGSGVPAAARAAAVGPLVPGVADSAAARPPAPTFSAPPPLPAPSHPVQEPPAPAAEEPPAGASPFAEAMGDAMGEDRPQPEGFPEITASEAAPSGPPREAAAPPGVGPFAAIDRESDHGHPRGGDVDGAPSQRSPEPPA